MTRVDPFLEVMGLATLWQQRAGVAASGVQEETPITVSAAVASGAGEMVADVGDAVDVAEVRFDVDANVVAGPGASEAEVAPLAVSSPVPHPLDWSVLREHVRGCTACRLSQTRTQTVFGVGDQQADWMVIGEGPGATEDQLGEPFVGQAGKLLDNMLGSLGISRTSGVFIANVVKCRPPGNRDPQADEIAACSGYLRQQIALVQPKVILALGRFAAQTLLQSDAKIGALRGVVHDYEGVPVVVTYHPAYLLRTMSDKAKAWEDLCLARRTLSAAAGRA